MTDKKNNLNEEVVQLIMESKLYVMSQSKLMTKVMENGTRQQILIWLERHQRRIYYREASANEDSVKTMDVSSVTDVGELESLPQGMGLSAKDLERGFFVQTGQAEQSSGNAVLRMILLAEDGDVRNTWVDGLVLACHMQGKESRGLLEEIMNLFIVESEIEMLEKEQNVIPIIPPPPDNYDFVTGPLN